MALLTNLVSYWKLDESSGNAADSHSSNTLTNVSATAYAAGKINNAMDQGESNTTDYLHVASALGLNTNQAGVFSLACWLKVRTAPVANDAVIFGINTNTSPQYYFCYSDLSSVKKLGFRSYTGAGGDALFINQTLTVGTFYHIVIVKNSTTVTYYVNGSSIGDLTITVADGNPSRAADFALGNLHFDPASIIGSFMMDEVGVWTKALSTTEISNLYNNGNGLAYPLTEPGEEEGPTSFKSLLGVGQA